MDESPGAVIPACLQPGRVVAFFGPEKLVGGGLGSLFCVRQRHGFDLDGIFPLEFTWVLTPFPKKLFWMRVYTIV